MYWQENDIMYQELQLIEQDSSQQLQNYMTKQMELADPNYSKRINKELNKMLIIFLSKHKIKQQHAIKLTEFKKIINNRLIVMQYEHLLYQCCICLTKYNDYNLYSKFLDLLNEQLIQKEDYLYLQSYQFLFKDNLEQAMHYIDKALEYDPNKVEYVEQILKIFDRKDDKQIKLTKREKKKLVYYISLLPKISESDFCVYIQSKNMLNKNNQEEFVKNYITTIQENTFETLIDVNMLNINQF